MKILIKGNLTVDGYITTTMPYIEQTYHAIGNQYEVNESEYDIIIDGDINIHSIRVYSEKIKITITGYIITS